MRDGAGKCLSYFLHQEFFLSAFIFVALLHGQSLRFLLWIWHICESSEASVIKCLDSLSKIIKFEVTWHLYSITFVGNQILEMFRFVMAAEANLNIIISFWDTPAFVILDPWILKYFYHSVSCLFLLTRIWHFSGLIFIEHAPYTHLCRMQTSFRSVSLFANMTLWLEIRQLRNGLPSIRNNGRMCRSVSSMRIWQEILKISE